MCYLLCVFVVIGLVVCSSFLFFFFNDTATTEIYTLSLHDALPISVFTLISNSCAICLVVRPSAIRRNTSRCRGLNVSSKSRSEEHTSELQSRLHLVCRLLLEKKKKNKTT